MRREFFSVCVFQRVFLVTLVSDLSQLNMESEFLYRFGHPVVIEKGRNYLHNHSFVSSQTSNVLFDYKIATCILFLVILVMDSVGDPS